MGSKVDTELRIQNRNVWDWYATSCFQYSLVHFQMLPWDLFDERMLSTIPQMSLNLV